MMWWIERWCKIALPGFYSRCVRVSLFKMLMVEIVIEEYTRCRASSTKGSGRR